MKGVPSSPRETQRVGWQARDSSPQRRHLHINRRGKRDAWAYVLQNSGHEKIDIYIMKFQLVRTERYGSKFRMKTAFGLSSQPAYDQATQFVVDHARYLKRAKNTDIFFFCDSSNWRAII